MKIKIALIVVWLLLLEGCVATTPLNAVPQTQDEFKLPPATLLARYPEIKKYQDEFAGWPMGNPRFNDVVMRWGWPESIRIESERKNVMTANLLGLAAAISSGSPLVMGIAGAVGLFTSPQETYTWNKGDYQIRATFSKLGDQQQLHYWDWRHKADNKLRPVFADDTLVTVYWMFGAAGGAEMFSAGVDTTENPAFGRAWYIGIGAKVKGPLENTQLYVSAGWKRGSETWDNGQKKITVTRIPLEALLFYGGRQSKWRLGGGISYHVNSKVAGNTSLNGALDDAAGFVAALEYSQRRKSILGFKLESIKQTLSSGVDIIDGSNVTFYSKNRF